MRAKSVWWLVAAVAALMTGVFGLLPGAATAAPTTPYPPSTCGQLAISTTTPNPGQPVTLSGARFTAHTRLTLEMRPGSYVLARPTTDGEGAFSVRVAIPSGTSGAHKIYVKGSNVARCVVDPISLNIGAANQGQGGGDGPNGAGGLAFTGLDVLILVLLGLALVALGVAAARGGRRRTAHGH